MILLLGCTGEAGDSNPVAVAAEPEAAFDLADVQFVGEAVTLDAGDSVGDTFTWDFGDGESATGAEVSHTWATGGRYTVRLTSANADGRSDTADSTIVVVWEPLATPPASSGRLALLDGVLYAAFPDADEVVVVEDGAVTARLATCGYPTSVSAAGTVLAVACRDDAVELWDTASRTRTAAVTLRWGARPVAVVAAEDGAYVALAGTGEIVRVEADGSVALERVVEDPGGLALADALYAPRFRSESEGVLYAGDGEFALPADPGPDSDTDARGLPNLLGSVAVRPDGRAVVVAGSKANMDRGLRRDGLALTFETTSRALLRSLDSTTGEQLARAYFDNRDHVGAVAFTPLEIGRAHV